MLREDLYIQLMEKVENATSMDDIKEIIRRLIDVIFHLI